MSPACGRETSSPKILPYRRRTSLELSEAILALYAAGVNTRAISRFLEGIYGAFYSPQSIPRLTRVVEEEVRAWRSCDIPKQVSKEIKRRTKVVEVFCGEEAVEKLLYMVLSNLNERLQECRLRGFAELGMGSYHAV